MMFIVRHKVFLYTYKILLCPSTMDSMDSTMNFATMDSMDSTMDFVLQLSLSSDESALYTTAALPCMTAFESAMMSSNNDISDVSSVNIMQLTGNTEEIPFDVIPVASSTLNSNDMNAALCNLPTSSKLRNLVVHSSSDIHSSSVQVVASSTLNSNDMDTALCSMPSTNLRSLRVIHSDSSGNSSNDMLDVCYGNISKGPEDLVEVPDPVQEAAEIEARLAGIPDTFPEPYMNHDAPAPTPLSDLSDVIHAYTHQPPDGDLIYFCVG